MDLAVLMGELDSRGVKTLLVEGGSEVIWSFFDAGLVDEYKVFIGGLVIGGTTSPTPAGGPGFEDLGKAVGGDARQGKATYVSAHGLDGARRLAAEAHERACLALAPLGPSGADLTSIADLTFGRRN